MYGYAFDKKKLLYGKSLWNIIFIRGKEDDIY